MATVIGILRLMISGFLLAFSVIVCVFWEITKWLKGEKLLQPVFGVIWTVLFKLMRKAMGISKVKVTGTLEPGTKVLVANHVSIMDILVLRSVWNCRFLSKQEVAGWPVVGWVARCLGVVFTSRRRHDIHSGVQDFQKDLACQPPIVLFAEGTTHDGCNLLPFKSSFFQLPEGTLIQPVSLRYKWHYGLPTSRAFRKRYSWRGNEPLWGHVRHVMTTTPMVVSLDIFPPLTASDGQRKLLARQCQELIFFGCHQPAHQANHPQTSGAHP